MVGTKILHYQLIEKIGAGGMGEIYKGQDSRLNRLVAVKILSPNLSTDPERKRRFFQEAQAASALNHPNIITLYDIVSEGDTQCIVMEFVAGKTLRELIPSGGLPPPQVLQYAAQIAGALTAAHAAGLIHRDLKPSNIMVTTSGLVKVLDFGLAKWVDTGVSGAGDQTTVETALTREGSIIGTVSYMSPEQAEGKRVDGRSDIFSFGSVLYEMLTGKRAFEGRSGISTLSSILRDDVKPIGQAAHGVPPDLEKIVLRCLPKEPAARWQSMKEIEVVLLALQRQLDPEGHFAPPVPPTPIFIPPQVASAAVAQAASSPSASVSVQSDESVESPPIIAAPVNGPPKPGPARIDEPPPPQQPNGVAHQTSAARLPTRPIRSSGAPPKLLFLLLSLIGVILLAGIGTAGWFWWRNHQPASAPVAVTIPPAVIPTPPPVESAPSAETTPTPQPSATPPTNPADAAKSAKANRPKKPKPDATLTPATPPPAAVTPAPALPPPVATLPPPPVIPTPKPVIPSTPVTVADALPFVMNLAEDVPADAPEGQALHFTVTEPLQIGDKTVVAKGATVTGTVMGESNKKKFLGIAGGGHKLTFRLTQVEAVDGRKLAVRAIAGKSDGATVRPFETGKGAKNKGYAAMQGTVYVGYIDGDQIVSVHK
jgi:serine/threonine protein kinase